MKTATFSFLLIVGLLGTIFSVLYIKRKFKCELSMNAVFLPQTIKPSSFDPLDGDHANNLPVMRMLNLTPIEVSISNQLTSQILSKFTYDISTRQIKFVVKGDKRFSDGTIIQAADLAFTISRMAYARPNFPVISEIVGVHEWQSGKHALRTFPPGISVQKNVVTITLVRNVDNPLFRFALEIFSIIPRSSVDVETNKLILAQPPTSGNYVITDETTDQIVFKLRETPYEGHQLQPPSKITFRYLETDPDFAHFKTYPKNMVFSGLELPLRAAKIDLEEVAGQVVWTPASSFAIVILNPSIAPFNDIKCRQLFAKTLLQEVSEIFGSDAGVEPSIFPRIVPGYLPSQKLQMTSDLSDAAKKLKNSRLRWTRFPPGQNNFYNQLIERTARRLGIELETAAELSSARDHEAEFYKLNTFCVFGRTGFWPLDPVGDIRMLFTPNLHQGLQVIWKDKHVTNSLDEIGKLSDPIIIRSQMEDLNRYFVTQSVFNSIAQFRRYFASSGRDTLREMPLAVQQPYAWQVFKVD